MTTFRKQLQALQQQADAAPWLKWAGLAVAVLLGLFCLQSLDKVRLDRQKAAIDAEQNLRRMLSLKGQDIWLEREKAATELRDSLLNQLPRVDTTGLAQAALQGWLREATAQFSTNQNIRINVGTPGKVDGLSDVLKVNAAISGNLSARESLGLLRQMESSPNLLVVESISIQSDASNVLQMTVNGYYRLGSESQP